MKDMMGQMIAAQKQMKAVQNTLSGLRITAEQGGGLIRATVDGEANLIDLEVDENLLTPDEIPGLTRLIKKAVITAQKKARETAAAHLKKTMGNLPIG